MNHLATRAPWLDAERTTGSGGSAAGSDWDLKQDDLVTGDELFRAVVLAKTIGVDDLRLGRYTRALETRGIKISDVSSRGLTDSTLIRRPAIAAFVRAALRLGSLTVVEDLYDVATRLADGDVDTRQRNIDIFVRRYGGGPQGESASRLQAVGNVYGLTRERVRQITDQMIERAEKCTIFSPAFSRLAEVLSTSLPLSDLHASSVLRHLLGPEISVIGALRYGAEVLNIKPPILSMHVWRRSTTRTLAWGRSGTSNHWLTAAYRVATSMIRGCGLAYLPRVTRDVEKIVGERIGSGAIASALESIGNCEWLDGDQEWFWFVSELHKNRLVIALRKMLATARRAMDIEEIYGGVARMRGDRVLLVGPYPPPPIVVLAFYSRLSIVKINQYKHVFPSVPLSEKVELSESELLIYRYMESRSGLASRKEMDRTLVEGGACLKMALHATLGTSPIIKRIDRGVFGLRGWPLTATIIGKAQAEAVSP